MWFCTNLIIMGTIEDGRRTEEGDLIAKMVGGDG
jgi:hypothetical protein